VAEPPLASKPPTPLQEFNILDLVRTVIDLGQLLGSFVLSASVAWIPRGPKTPASFVCVRLYILWLPPDGFSWNLILGDFFFTKVWRNSSRPNRTKIMWLCTWRLGVFRIVGCDICSAPLLCYHCNVFSIYYFVGSNIHTYKIQRECFVAFYGNNGHANASQCYFMLTLSTLFYIHFIAVIVGLVAESV